MTIIVTWINKENIDNPRLWTITDSRLSKISESSGSAPLLDCGAKLFSLRINMFTPGEEGFFNRLRYSTTIRMAFAGSALLGLNLNSLLNYTLGNLGAFIPIMPKIEDIAKHASSIFQVILNNYINLNLDSTPCAVSIFGYCFQTKAFKLFHMASQKESPKILFNEVALIDDNAIHIFGDCIQEIRESIMEFRTSSLSRDGIGWLRFPKSCIEKIICDETYKTIGGGMQLGIASPSGFELRSICRPIIPGQSKATFIHQGIDLFSEPHLMQIGECSVNIRSMV